MLALPLALHRLKSASVLRRFYVNKKVETTMVKKLKTLAKSDDKQLADAVLSSAQQIWQAGLGAFAKAQNKDGKVFAQLVKKGTELQKRTGTKSNGKVAATVANVADKLSGQVSGSWDKLEQVFEERVSRSLKNLGVPTQSDILALTKRVEELSKAVATLGGQRPVTVKAKAAAATKAAAKKTAVKSVAKKTAVKRPTVR